MEFFFRKNFHRPKKCTILGPIGQVKLTVIAKKSIEFTQPRQLIYILHTFGFKTKVTLELEFPESPFLLGNNEEKLRSFNRFGDFFRCSSNEAKLLGLPLDLGSNNEAKLRSGLFCWAPSIDAKFR